MGSDALKPDIALLSKIGSIVVHADELLSPKGHVYDKTVFQQLLNDPDVQMWIKQMGPLLPQKR